MRKSLMASVLEIVEANSKLRDRLALFEIGPIFLMGEEGVLPEEQLRLVLVLTGPNQHPSWGGGEKVQMDFYDLKGVVDKLLNGLHVEDVGYETGKHPLFHPGKTAQIMAGEKRLGDFGELHPLVQEKYDFSAAPVLAATFNLEVLMAEVPPRHEVAPVPAYPPVLEDLAFIVEEAVPAVAVQKMIAQTGGKILSQVRLFDVYRGEQIGSGMKSLAYSLMYQDQDRTLTDDEVAKLRNKIVRRLENELGAKLRDN